MQPPAIDDQVIAVAARSCPLIMRRNGANAPLHRKLDRRPLALRVACHEVVVADFGDLEPLKAVVRKSCQRVIDLLEVRIRRRDLAVHIRHLISGIDCAITGAAIVAAPATPIPVTLIKSRRFIIEFPSPGECDPCWTALFSQLCRSEHGTFACRFPCVEWTTATRKSPASHEAGL